MDLALHFGMPVGALKRAMHEREFGQWVGYRLRHKLPQERLEYYLAQICLVVAQTLGGSRSAKLSDFILDFDSKPASDKADDVEADDDELKAAFGFRPVARKNGP